MTYTLELLDAAGQRCSVQEFSSDKTGLLETQVAWISMGEGCYVCQVRCNGGVLIKPVVVVH